MIKYAKISDYKVKKIILCFSNNLNATETSKLLKLNRTTINKYYSYLRVLIYNHTETILKRGVVNCSICCGYYRTEYGEQHYYNIYYVDNIFLAQKTECSMICKKMALNSKSINKAYLKNFDRITKFYGIDKNSHYLHVIESVYRMSFNEDELFEKLVKLLKNSKI